MSKYSKKNPLNQIYGKVLAMLLITLTLIAINLLATLTAPQQAMRRESGVTRYAPGNPAYEVMKRESEPTRSILVNLPNGRTLVWEVA